IRTGADLLLAVVLDPHFCPADFTVSKVSSHSFGASLAAILLARVLGSKYASTMSARKFASGRVGSHFFGVLAKLPFASRFVRPRHPLSANVVTLRKVHPGVVRCADALQVFQSVVVVIPVDM